MRSRRIAKSRKAIYAEAENVLGGRVKALVIKKEDPPSPEDEALKAAMLSVYVKDEKERPTICFMCLGNEKAPFNTRVYSFSSPSDLSKHFKRKHLRPITEGQTLGCELYKMSLDHKMHLQNHAARIHGTIS
jgi:hypothetical protein